MIERAAGAMRKSRLGWSCGHYGNKHPPHLKFGSGEDSDSPSGSVRCRAGWGAEAMFDLKEEVDCQVSVVAEERSRPTSRNRPLARLLTFASPAPTAGVDPALQFGHAPENIEPLRNAQWDTLPYC